MPDIASQFRVPLQVASWIPLAFDRCIPKLHNRRQPSPIEHIQDIDLWMVGPSDAEDRNTKDIHGDYQLFLTGFGPCMMEAVIYSINPVDRNTILVRAGWQWYRLERVKSAQHVSQLLGYLMQGRIPPVAVDILYDDETLYPD